MLDVVSRDTMVETGIDIFCSRLCGRSDRKFDGKFLRRYQGYVPRRLCGAPDPFDPWNGLGEGNTRGYQYGRNHSTGGTQESGGFSLGGFVRDTLTGAVIGGLGSAGFYGAGRAVEVLRGSVGRSRGGRELSTASSYGIDMDNLNFSNTVQNHTGRPYQDSKLLIHEIIEGKPPVTDPRGTNAWSWTIKGTFNGSTGYYELVIDSQSNTVWHFVFKSQ